MCSLPAIYLGLNYGGGNEDNDNPLQKIACVYCYTHCSQPWSRPPPIHASTGDSRHSRASLGQSFVGSLLLSPGSWWTQGSVCALQESISESFVSSGSLHGGVNGDLFQGGLCHTQLCCTQSPCPCGSPLLTRTSTGDAQTQFVLITQSKAFHLVLLLSHVWFFVTPWTAARQASLSNTNSWSLLKLISNESLMPSNHLILCYSFLLLPSIFPSIRVFSNESALCIRWPKYWSFSFNISPSNEHSELISFRMDWLDLLAVQGTLKSLLQHHCSKASILCSLRQHIY